MPHTATEQLPSRRRPLRNPRVRHRPTTDPTRPGDPRSTYARWRLGVPLHLT